MTRRPEQNSNCGGSLIGSRGAPSQPIRELGKVKTKKWLALPLVFNTSVKCLVCFLGTGLGAAPPLASPSASYEKVKKQNGGRFL